MRNQFEQVPMYSLVNSLDWWDTVVDITPGFIGKPEINDIPGVAVINPTNGDAREMIGFAGVSVHGNTITLLEVQRGIHGTRAMIHPTGTEIYFDQGTQYERLADNSAKQVLKRSLRRLLQ